MRAALIEVTTLKQWTDTAGSETSERSSEGRAHPRKGRTAKARIGQWLAAPCSQERKPAPAFSNDIVGVDTVWWT